MDLNQAIESLIVQGYKVSKKEGDYSSKIIINKVMSFKDNVVQFVEYVFWNSERNFYGATGFELEPLTREEHYKFIEEMGGEQCVDDSFKRYWDAIRKEIGVDAYRFECIGGGRIFTKGFTATHNKELETIIKTFENENK
jgi:hypothetical protein